MDEKLYIYRAVIQSVYDGDTCRANIDLGIHTWVHNEKLRLARINAPEIKGTEKEDGLKARDFLRALIQDKQVLVETIKDRRGTYGRYLAEIWLKQDDNSWLNVNDYMVASGHAKYVSY